MIGHPNLPNTVHPIFKHERAPLAALASVSRLVDLVLAKRSHVRCRYRGAVKRDAARAVAQVPLVGRDLRESGRGRDRPSSLRGGDDVLGCRCS